MSSLPARRSGCMALSMRAAIRICLAVMCASHSRLPFLPQAPCDSFRRFLVGIEGAQSPPPPACELIGLAYLLVFIFLQPVCEFKEGAQQGSPIIVHQLDQPGLLHQSAEFNQLSGAGAPVLHPLAGVIAGTVAIAGGYAARSGALAAPLSPAAPPAVSPVAALVPRLPPC